MSNKDPWYYFELLHKHWLAQTDCLVRCVANGDDEEWEKTVARQEVTSHYQNMLLGSN